MNTEPKTVTAHTKPDLYIDCPMCGEDDFQVDHLESGQTTAWYCDKCGGKFGIEVRGGKYTITQFILTPLPDRKEKTLVTLQSKGPVRLIVEGIRLTDCPKEEGHDEYFYNEHTCPTNYLSSVVKCIDPADGNEDPHGIFEYVSTEPWRDLEK